jgi:hypothetical protein
MSIAPLGRSKDISWSLTSKKDPRWNTSGQDTVGMMFQTAPGARRHIKRMKKKYGKKPSDLEYEAYKD